MAVLKQSTAYTRMFLLVQSSDHITPLTGATAAVTISKAGGAFGAAGGTVTEVSSGWYKIALTTTDTATLGDLAFHITATSGDATDFVDQVTANILGDTLPVNVTTWSGAAVSAPATAGIPEVNVKNINNVSTSSVTTINANQGTTQPLNFTGTGASALVKTDMVDIAGAAVSASTAQLGVNIVNIAGAAVSTSTAQLGVNLVNIAGAAVSATTAQLGVNAVKINNVATTSVTTINANVGQTQPVNFTGTAGSALVKTDMVDIAGAAVSTSTAQIGTNVVTVAGAASNIKKNQALAGFEFLMTDSTTHAPKTGLTITATRSLNGAAFGACANSATEISSGVYTIDLAAGDLNGNTVMLRFTSSGADDRLIEIITQP